MLTLNACSTSTYSYDNMGRYKHEFYKKSYHPKSNGYDAILVVVDNLANMFTSFPFVRKKSNIHNFD